MFRSLFFFLMLLWITASAFAEEVVLSQLFHLPGKQIPCGDNSSSNRLRIWVHPVGNWSQSDQGNSEQLDFYSGGLTFGIDKQIGRNFLAGFSLGGDQTTAKVSSLHWRETITGYQTAAYLRSSVGRFFFDFEGGFGLNDPGGFHHDATQWNLNGEAGTWWSHGLGKTEPYIRLQHIEWDDKTETDSKDTLIIGVRYSWKQTGELSVITPRLYGGLVQELGDKTLFSSTVFGDSPTVFHVPGFEVDETRLFLGGGFTSSMGSSLDLYLRYTAEFASKYSSHTIFLGMNWNF